MCFWILICLINTYNMPYVYPINLIRQSAYSVPLKLRPTVVKNVFIIIIIITHAGYVETLCLFVCLFVRCITEKQMISKCSKLV